MKQVLLVLGMVVLAAILYVGGMLLLGVIPNTNRHPKKPLSL